MKVLKLNAYFSLMFILWCFFAIYMATYFYEILGSFVKLVLGFYLIVAFAVYRNIWASKNEEYARKCFRVSIGGFAAVSVAQILLCFYSASFLGDPRGRISGPAEGVLLMVIPALPLSLFGFSLSVLRHLIIAKLLG
uniref:Uncharacterized protein n=1 Tax=Panagrolaimus sp. PS1159 TaxID=55785 RepID=A0AC35FMZ0_9BILA